MIGDWDAVNVLNTCIAIIQGLLWNIQRRLQHIQNINVDTQIDKFGLLRSVL